MVDFAHRVVRSIVGEFWVGGLSGRCALSLVYGIRGHCVAGRYYKRWFRICASLSEWKISRCSISSRNSALSFSQYPFLQGDTDSMNAVLAPTAPIYARPFLVMNLAATLDHI